MDTFGRRLRAWLLARGISQAELARRLGLRPPTICEWAKDVSSPSMARMPAIAEALGISVAEFYGEVSPPVEDAPEAA